MRLQGKQIRFNFSARNFISHEKEILENIPNNIIVVTFANKREKISKQCIRDQFSTFGKIKEILIFKRKYKMCLVEFESKFNATKAMETYDQTVIQGLGFVRIKFSNRSRIIPRKIPSTMECP